jgi:hypothetical protein
MAQVGMEPIPTNRQCEHCNKMIPRWVSKARRFCSDSCAGKARRKSAKSGQVVARG